MIESRQIIYLPGDPQALAAIRDGTRSYYGATDIRADAEIFIWHGILVRGSNGREYEVPDEVRARYIERRPFPASPIARMPSAPPRQPSYEKAETLEGEDFKVGGVPLEGEQEAIDFIRLTTRLYHEVSAVIFPDDGEVRWFRNGLFVVGADKRLFQVPMDRIEDLIVPQVYPELPTVRMTERARLALTA